MAMPVVKSVTVWMERVVQPTTLNQESVARTTLTKRHHPIMWVQRFCMVEATRRQMTVILLLTATRRLTPMKRLMDMPPLCGLMSLLLQGIS